MSEGVEQGLQTAGKVSEYFTVQSQFLATSSADCYRAVDKSRNTDVFLWLLRQPVNTSADQVRSVLFRLNEFSQLSTDICDLVAYAVDSEGIAFAVFPAIDGYSVDSGNVEAVEGERRFIQCLRYIEVLHDSNIVCGDLSGASFWQGRNSGELRFIGVMGAPLESENSSALLPPAEAFPYIAPENRSGRAVSMKSDVFSLGVLGYKLLTKNYPYGGESDLLEKDFSIEQVKPVSGHIGLPPVWAEEVLSKCLSPDPAKRYENAGEIAEAIHSIRQRALEQEKLPVKTESVPAVRKDQNRLTIRPEGLASTKVEFRDDNQRRGPRKATYIALFLGVFVAVGGILVGGGFFTQASKSVSAIDQDLADLANAADSNSVGNAIGSLANTNTPLAALSAELDELVNSADPLAHDILIRKTRGVSDSEVRELVESRILERARVNNLTRSAEQAQEWLNQFKGFTPPESYESVLRMLDSGMPSAERSGLLRIIYAEEPLLALRLASGYVLDTKEFDEHQVVVSQLVGDSLDLEDAKTHSTVALLLASPEISELYGEELVAYESLLPDADILWLLLTLGKRADSQTSPLSVVAISRGLVSPTREKLLRLVSEDRKLPGEVVEVLVRSASGTLGTAEINALGKWFDLRSEEVILAILADTTEPKELLESAFGILAGKSLSQEPSSSLIKWVRENQWDNRAEFANAIGILANTEAVDTEEIGRAISVFDPHMKDSNKKLLDILLSTNHPQIVRPVVNRYPKLLGLGGLLKLLENEDKEVRMNAIRSLKKYNDVGALKIIIGHFEDEKDEQVRDVYRETFWVIKERDAG